MGCNPVQFILWLVVLIFLSFFVAFFCAPLYVIVHCLSGFLSPLSLYEYKHFGASINSINMRNLEIKASIRDWKTINDKAKELSGSEPTTIHQRDTFFTAIKGRLKLRRFEDDSGELIFYHRPDTLQPKLSHYIKMDMSMENCEVICNMLTESNGVLGTVEKTRFLYMVGQSRIHIDAVLNLGTFVEIEVVLRDDQDAEAGQKIMGDLMEKLGIQSSDLISKAYLDRVLAKTK